MPFNFNLATSVTFGAGSYKNLSNILQKTNSKKVFFVFDRGIEEAGIKNLIFEEISKCCNKIMCFNDVKADPTDTLITTASKDAEKFQADAIIALGGGSSIDCAKAINVLFTNKKEIGEYIGRDKVENPVKPLIAIPTTAGTGSEVTDISVVNLTKEKMKLAIAGKNVRPSHALLDPELTLNLPKDLTGSTGMDALTHAIESFTTKEANQITDIFAIKAASLILKSILKAYENGNDIEARENMLLGSFFAGVAFSNSGLGFTHSISHGLGAHCGIAHGIANAILLPLVMEFNMQKSKNKFSKLAEAVGFEKDNEENMANKLISHIKDLRKKLRIPSLSNQNINPKNFMTIANDSVKYPTASANPRTPSVEDAMFILEKAFSENYT